MSEHVQGPVEGPPEPSGRAPRRWSRAFRPARFAVAGAGAAVVVIGVVLGLVLSGVFASSAPAPAVMWSKAAPAKLAGAWVDGDNLVVGDLNSSVLTAYSLSTGAVRWKRAVPDGGQLCSMSSDLGTGDLGVIFYSTDDGYCTYMQTIDAATGGLGWAAPANLDQPLYYDLSPQLQAAPEISGNVIVAPHNQGVAGYTTASNKLLWQAQFGNGYCAPGSDGVVGQRIYVYYMQCPTSDYAPGDGLVAYNAANGQSQVQLLSDGCSSLTGATMRAVGDNLVLDCDPGGSGSLYQETSTATAVTGLQTGGVPAVGYSYQGSGGVQSETSGDSAVYVSSAAANAAVVAVGLPQDKPLWTVPLSQSDVICGADSGGALVLSPNAADPDEYSLVRYSAAGGTKSSVGTYKSASLAYLGESPTTPVSGYYVVLIATELQPAITVLRT